MRGCFDSKKYLCHHWKLFFSLKLLYFLGVHWVWGSIITNLDLYKLILRTEFQFLSNQSIFMRSWKSYSEKFEQAFFFFWVCSVFMVVTAHALFLGLSYLILIKSSQLPVFMLQWNSQAHGVALCYRQDSYTRVILANRISWHWCWVV